MNPMKKLGKWYKTQVSNLSHMRGKGAEVFIPQQPRVIGWRLLSGVLIPWHFKPATHRSMVAPTVPEEAIRHGDVGAAMWKSVEHSEMTEFKGYGEGTPGVC